jgi:hypothetical protein
MPLFDRPLFVLDWVWLVIDQNVRGFPNFLIAYRVASHDFDEEIWILVNRYRISCQQAYEWKPTYLHWAVTVDNS